MAVTYGAVSSGTPPCRIGHATEKSLGEVEDVVDDLRPVPRAGQDIADELAMVVGERADTTLAT